MMNFQSSWSIVSLGSVTGRNGLITDGDWIVAKNMDPDGEVRLIQLADIGKGEFLDRSSKFIRSEKFRELNCTALQENDVLISRMADPIGRACLLPKLEQKAITAVDVTIVRTDKAIADPIYIKYLCNTQYFFEQAQVAATGTTRSRITRKNLEKIKIPLPPLAEQWRIVEILDQADALRKKRADADAKAERILPALFYKIFGNPVTNSKDWDVTNLSNGGASVRYGLGQPPEADPDGIPLIRATNIRRGIISDENMMFVSHASVPETRNAFLTSDEVIVVRSGAYTGDVAQVTEQWAGSVAGYDLIVTPGKGFCGEFIEAYLLTPHIQKNYFGNLKARAGQPHLNASQLSATPILRPPKDLQLHFAEQVRNIRQLRNRIVYCQQRLDVLLSVLLSRAFSGELTAKWRESHMKELLIEIEEQTRVFQNIG